jgi:hypothetical protein
MRKISTIAAFVAVLGIGTGFAYAQGEPAGFVPQLYGGSMTMITPDGHMQTVKMTDEHMKSMMTDMMKNGQTLSAPMMMMMMSDGKVHMMPDTKMSDGKMMSEHMMADQTKH